MNMSSAGNCLIIQTSDIRAVRCYMSCLTANMYMLSERGVGSLIPKVRQTEGRVFEENFSQDPGLMSRVSSRSAYQRVVSSSFMHKRIPRIVERTNMGLSCKSFSYLLCNPGLVI